jgi:mono/diheme cytochrome c family protein
MAPQIRSGIKLILGGMALFLFAPLLLLSCGGGLPTPELPGDPTRGEKAFSTYGCRGCHMVNGKGGTVGPDLSDIGGLAGTLKPGVTAEAFIHEAIAQPDAFVRKGYQAGLMPGDYEQRLSRQEFDDLVAYLLTLK